MDTHQPTNRLAVDIGGTFTDVVVETGGVQFATKVLTTAEGPEKGVITGVEVLLREIGLKAADLGLMVHGTTLATNAIIERKGAVTALITTEGFRDVLDIADEGRYDQYDIYLEKPRPLVPRHLRFTVPERVSIDGNILKPLERARGRSLGAQVAGKWGRERGGWIPAWLPYEWSRAPNLENSQ